MGNINVTQISQHKIADSITRCSSGKKSKSFYDLAIADSTAKLDSMSDKSVVAGLLSNFQAVMDSELGQQLTTSANYGPYVMELWPVVTAWYPDFPLRDLISVQDMDKPLAYLIFSRLLTGNDKAPTVVGEEVETPLGKRKIRGHYPTGEIFGEEIPAAQMENDGENTIALLHYSPLNVNANYLEKYRLVVTGGDAAGTYKAVSAVGDFITFANVETPQTVSNKVKIDLTTGAIYVAESTKQVTKVTANYVWNLDYAKDENIPTVKEDMELVTMEAVPRAIGMKWTIFSEYLKKSQFGTDIREENTKRVLNLLYQFQVRYILDELYDYSEGGTGTITIPGSTTMSVEVKSQEVTRQLKAYANDIENASGRMEGNRIVCGKNFKIFVESLPSTLFKPEPVPTGFSGPRHIGDYGTFKVYYDPFRADTEAMMTYRGSEWYDAVYYLGSFMPIVPTDAIALGVNVREAFCSMEAYKYHKKNCVKKLTINYA